MKVRLYGTSARLLAEYLRSVDIFITKYGDVTVRCRDCGAEVTLHEDNLYTVPCACEDGYLVYISPDNNS